MEDSTKSATGRWEKPELVILVRSHAEENVLAACKTATKAGGATATKSCAGAGCNTNGTS